MNPQNVEAPLPNCTSTSGVDGQSSAHQEKQPLPRPDTPRPSPRSGSLFRGFYFPEGPNGEPANPIDGPKQQHKLEPKPRRVQAPDDKQPRAVCVDDDDYVPNYRVAEQGNLLDLKVRTQVIDNTDCARRRIIGRGISFASRLPIV